MRKDKLGADSALGERNPRIEALVYRSAQVFLIVWASFHLMRGLAAGLYFDGPPADGPFQIFNPLRRIAAGQIPGLDFQFYHGVGVPFLHYPLFAALGKTLMASELSRQLTSLIFFVASLGLFAWLATRSIRKMLIGSAVVILALELAFRLDAVGPGNSQIGVRSTFPVFTFAILMAKISDTAKALAFGLGLGASLVFGFEQGIAMTLGLVFVYGVSLAFGLFQGRTRTQDTIAANLRFVAITLFAAGVSFVSLMTAFCGFQGMLGALRYNLIDLPTDKFWYDGSPPNPFLSSLGQLLTPSFIFPILPPLVAVIVLLLLLPSLRKRELRFGRDWEMLAAAMLSYGILSTINMLGIYSKHYTFPLCRILCLVALIGVIHHPAVLSWIRGLTKKYPSSPAILSCGVAAICLIFTAVLGTLTARTVIAFAGNRADASIHGGLGTRWSRYMETATATVDTHRRPNRPFLLWSTYSSLLESHYGLFHPVEDYLTIVVGPKRRENYFATFRQLQPEFVETIWPGYTPYEEWLENVDWPFYEDIVNNYDLLGRADFALLWQRKSQPWVAPETIFEDLTVDRSCNCIRVRSDNKGATIGVVKLNYTIHNPWTKLPFFGLVPRYLLTPHDTPRNCPVSLPHYKTEITFPLELENGEVRLDLETKSLLPGASFTIDRVQLKRLPWRQELMGIMAIQNQPWEQHDLSLKTASASGSSAHPLR